MNNKNPFGEIIYSYTREQALEDGVLIDVTDIAKEVGIIHPTAITEGILEAITPDKRLETEPKTYEAILKSRIWDILWMMKMSIVQSKGGRKVNSRAFIAQKWVKYKAECGPGDNGEPIITIMLPHED